jgi:hypothetical protein
VAQTGSIEIGPVTRKGDSVSMRSTIHASIRRGASRDSKNASSLHRMLRIEGTWKIPVVRLQRAENGHVTCRVLVPTEDTYVTRR